MKRNLLTILVVLLTGIIAHAQVSGTFTIGGPEYPTIRQAIAALNLTGVGDGGVVFNVPAGYTETFVTDQDGILTTTSSNVARPIIFQKSGSGPNPVVTAGVGTTTNRDAVFALGGTDYVTFDGINVRDNPANTTSTTRMEFGYWLARASDADGTQHVTIKNCKIYDMLKNYAIASTNHTLGYVSVNPSSPAGANSYNKIYSDSLVNTIVPAIGNKPSQSVYFVAASNVSTTGFYDLGNEIGVDGANVFLNSMFLSCTYQKDLKISNNLFSTNDIYPVTCPNHIYTANGYDVRIENNNIGEFNLLTTLGSYRAINDISQDSVKIKNNYIHHISYGNTITGSFTGIECGSNVKFAEVTGNIINNNSIGGLSTTTGYFRGINAGSGNMAADSYFNINDNIISDNLITSSAGTAENSFIRITWYGWHTNIFNNIISNNGMNCMGTTIAIDARSITANLVEKRIYGNKIDNLTNSNGSFHGIRHAYGLMTYIYQNRFSRISMNGNANPVFYGITVENASTALVYIFNNYIYDITTPQSNGSRVITGLNIEAGQMVDAFYNTIYLDAVSSSSGFGTAGIYSSTSSVLKLRNNNIINVSVPVGNSRTVALQLSSASLGNFDPGSNNNNYYAGVPGPNNLIFYDGTNSEETLSSYQERVLPAENESVTELTSFVNVTSSPYNMRINSAQASRCESGGSLFTGPEIVEIDYYGTPRYPNTGYPFNPSYPAIRPDIGAEEFGGIFSDLSAPLVFLTPLPNTSLTSARTLTTEITDLTGVPVNGDGLPVLYWRINNGSWNPATAEYMSGNQYDFTFGEGVLPGDTVNYFIIAQDEVTAPSPNIGSTPPGAGGFTYNPPAFITPPENPFEYVIIPSLCGIYYIGEQGDYPTLSAAVNDLNINAITCPVTLLLTDTLYANETFPIVIDRIPGLSYSNTLTIKPAPGVTTKIIGSHPESLITLNGANYVIIDGSNSNGTDRNLLISNTNPGDVARVIYISNPGGFNKSASNCIIKNCRIKSSPQLTNNTYAIVTKTTTLGNYNNIIIQNNEIYSAKFGVRIQGSVAYPATNCKIIDNIIGSPVDSISIQRVGIFIQSADNTLIQGNDVMGPSVYGNNQNGQVGIWLYTLATNTKVTRNQVHGFYNNTTLYGAMGIQFRAEGNTVTEISNNVIYDIKGPGSQTIFQDIAGISILNGGNVRIWHNSINLEGAVLSTTNPTKSGCIVLSNAVGNIDIRNNILKNSLIPASGTADARTYAIYSGAPASAFSALDNNDYYINGSNPNIGRLDNVTDYPTLAVWKNATGMDANTLATDPLFSSPTYLLPTQTSLNNLGTYMQAVPVDYTGTQRNNPCDIGAYEFGNDPFVITLSSNSITTNSANITGAANPAGGTVTTFFDYGTSSSYGYTVSATPPMVSGSTTTPLSASLSGLSYGTTYHYRARAIKTTGMISYGADSTFTTLPLVPSVITTEATYIASNAATLNGTVNPNGGPTVVTFQWGLTESYGNTINAIPGTINGLNVISVFGNISGLTPYTTYHYRVVATNASGTIYGNDMTVTTLAIPSIVVTEMATEVVGPLATLNGTVNPNYAPTNVTFEWGLSTSYGNVAYASPYTVTGNSTTPVSATISGLTQATEYHFRCVGSGPGGIVYGFDQVFISDCPTPVNPGTISGPVHVCKSSAGIVYSVNSIPNTSGYFWTVPAGATIVSGDNTNSITVDFSSSAISGDIVVNGINSCGNGPSSSLAIVVHELPVPTVSGPGNACYLSNNNVYTTESGNIDYSWTVNGGTINSGAGTSAITVTWNTLGTKSVSVTYASPYGCNAASPATMNVIVESLDTPGIVGNMMACAGSTYNVYTTEAGLDIYNWTVSSGGTIVGGQGTYQIEVNWNVAGNQTVTVDYEYENGCSPLAPGSVNVEVMPVPGAAGAITGTSSLCAGTQAVSYSIAAVPNTLNYIWTLPEGAAIVNGENTIAIIVDFADNAVSGDITVTPVNICGSGAPSPVYAVDVYPIPPTPVITADENFLLTSSAPAGNQWYLNGELITGATGQTYQAEEEGTYTVIVTLEGCSSEVSNMLDILFTWINHLDNIQFSIFPVPNDGKFYISVIVPDTETFDLKVYSSIGVKAYEKNALTVSGNAHLLVEIPNPSNGIYTVVLTGESLTVTRKILISR
jgi:trimeric autotransporter adhesin